MPSGDDNPRKAVEWIDLCGIANRRPWTPQQVQPRGPRAPSPAAREQLIGAAADWFGCLPAQVLPVSDASAALRRIVQSLPAGAARVVANPDTEGREVPPDRLRSLAHRVGQLVVDERLTDARPDLSLIPDLPGNVLVLRDVRTFWGLPGPGFAVADPALSARLLTDAQTMNPGNAALAMGDRDWADRTIMYLAEAVLRLDRLAARAGWGMAGGTHLFRLYDMGNAPAAQDRLARARIAVRCLSENRLRLAIPAGHAEWDRLTEALREFQADPAHPDRTGFPSVAPLRIV